MSYLAAGVVLVGVLGFVNLLLGVAVVRRLREHETRLDELGPGFGAEPPWLLVGSSLPEFTSATVAGAVVSQQTLAHGRAVVAFLQRGCGPCQELVPDLLRYAAELPDGQARMLAVVVDGPDRPGDLVEALGEVAEVVAGRQAAAMVDALAVRGFPTVYSLEDGTVRWAGPRLPGLGCASSLACGVGAARLGARAPAPVNAAPRSRVQVLSAAGQ